MKYYLKKLGRQELGSVDSNGRTHRGRYMYISKDVNALSFFPPLSSIIINDCALIPMLPLYLKKKVYCNYVYHNDKLISPTGTRNEYRIYLNSQLEEKQLLFKQDDIVIMKKDDIEVDSKQQTVYFMDLLSNHSSTMYKFCDHEISSSMLKGGHGIYDGLIVEFEEKVDAIKHHGEVDVLIDDSVTEKIKGKEKEIAELFNSSSFRDFVLVGYSNICAVTKTVIKWNSYNNLEAAHIKPRSHGGLFMPDNGIALCRDIHWAFDKGFFTIDKDLKVVVHKDIQSDYLRSFDGKMLTIPSNPFFVPNQENLKYHQENVFGLFKTTGRL